MLFLKTEPSASQYSVPAQNRQQEDLLRCTEACTPVNSHSSNFPIEVNVVGTVSELGVWMLKSN